MLFTRSMQLTHNVRSSRESNRAARPRMSEDLDKRCRTFWQTFASPDGAGAAHQMYTRGLVMCDTTSNYRDISPTPPIIV